MSEPCSGTRDGGRREEEKRVLAVAGHASLQLAHTGRSSALARLHIHHIHHIHLNPTAPTSTSSTALKTFLNGSRRPFRTQNPNSSLSLSSLPAVRALLLLLRACRQDGVHLRIDSWHFSPLFLRLDVYRPRRELRHSPALALVRRLLSPGGVGGYRSVTERLRIENTAGGASTLPVRIYTSHCTGHAACSGEMGNMRPIEHFCQPQAQPETDKPSCELLPGCISGGESIDRTKHF